MAKVQKWDHVKWRNQRADDSPDIVAGSFAENKFVSFPDALKGTRAFAVQISTNRAAVKAVQHGPNAIIGVSAAALAGISHGRGRPLICDIPAHDEEQQTPQRIAHGSLSVLAGVATLLALATTATANVAAQVRQETETRATMLEEIIVTAQRRAENAQDVPISMSVFSRDFIRQYLSDPYEVANFTPNYQNDNNFGLTRSNASIRGLRSSDTFDHLGSTSILTYYDGIAAGTPYTSAMPHWDLDRIEVLRGPQGTLFGRNAVAGAIQYLSAAPTDEFEGYGEFTVGEFDLRRFEAAVGGPITANVKGRLSATIYDRAGDVSNTFLDERVGERDWWGLRGIVDWQIADHFDVRVKAQHLEGDQDELNFNAAPGAMMPAAFQAWFAGVGHDPDLPRNSNFERLQSVLEEPFSTADLELVQVDLNYDFGPARLTAIVGYLDGKNRINDDAVTMPVQIYDELAATDITQWSGEVRLTSQTNHPLQWIAGAYYQDTDDSSFFDLDVSGFFVADGLTPVPVFAGAGNVFSTGGAAQQLETYAFFLHTTRDWTEHLKTTHAVRYTHEEKSINYRFFSLFEFPVSPGVESGTPAQHDDFVNFAKLGPDQQRRQAVSIFSDPNTLDADGNVVPFPLSDSWNEVTWRFAVDYRLRDGALLYASISRGFKGGIFSVLADPAAAVSAGPEVSIVYEVGAKSQWLGDRLQVNVSAFYNDHSNLQTLLLTLSADGSVFYLLDNLPEAELYGGEIEITAIPTDNLFIAANLGFIEAKITKVPPGNENVLGNRLPLAEDMSFSGLVGYDIHTAPGMFSPHLSWRYRGEYWTTKENIDIPRKLGGFWTVDLRLGYESPQGKLYGLLYWKNLFDEVQPVASAIPDAALGTTASRINERRNWGVTIGYRF